jgi:uncharacterized protein (TIGR02118 family)
VIKLIYCLRRLPGLSLEEFQDHWLEHHADLGRPLKGLRRYVQYHTLANDPIREAMAQAGTSTVDPYDGLSIAWWDSAESLGADMGGSPAMEAAMDDQRKFVDHSRSVTCLTREEVIVEPVGSVPYVLIECLRRRTELDRTAFQAAWLRHADIGRRANEQGLLAGYIQNHTLLGDAGRVKGLGCDDEPWDGIVTAYVDSVATFKALVSSPLAAEESFEDERKFIDHSRSVDMLTRRHVIVDVAR